MSCVAAEVEGYGAYKPVPPPKPLSSCITTTCYSPPPYRMPPYPLYGETAIPGTAASEPPAASNTSGLHTHSSKFPVSSSYSVNPIHFTVTYFNTDHFFMLFYITFTYQVVAQSLSHKISVCFYFLPFSLSYRLSHSYTNITGSH
jgi:hypothetical protein